MRFFAGLVLGTLLVSSWVASAMEIVHSKGSSVLPDGLPFSEAVRVGDVLYLSGQVGVVPGQLVLVSGGLGPETHQTLRNIKTVLGANGLGLADIIRCTVMLADITEWDMFNDIYKSYFSAPYPARSAMGVNGLALGARVEVECTAAFGN
ncbi:MAG: RidA family protein [Congregibacter sp.]